MAKGLFQKRPSDEAIDIGAMLASVTLFVLEARRAAGGVTTANGIYQLSRGRKASGVANLAVGGSFLLFPDWPKSVSNYLSDKLDDDEKKLPPSKTEEKKSTSIWVSEKT